MPFSRLFRNRYAALLWAAGIVWMAYDVADTSAPQPTTTVAEQSDDAAALRAAAAAMANLN